MLAAARSSLCTSWMDTVDPVCSHVHEPQVDARAGLMLPSPHLQVNTKRDAKYSLKASYLEIYNEGVFDLVHFSPKAKSLPVKWDASYGFYVQGLKVGPELQCSQLTAEKVGLQGLSPGSHACSKHWLAAWQPGDMHTVWYRNRNHPHPGLPSTAGCAMQPAANHDGR